MQRRVFAALAGLATLGAVAFGALASGAAERVPAYIAAAVADPARPQADRDRDTARKPADMLVFMGIKPGQRVVDFMPGYPSYFTGMFADAVGPKGVVYAFIPSELAARAKQPLPPSGTHIDPRRPNVIALVAPVDQFATPEKVDIIWTSQNYHDLHDPFMGPADMAVFDKAVFNALRPGGVFVVLDHAAEAGSGVRDTNTLHRIDPAAVKREVTAVGFTFAGESDVLRNPADPHTKLVFDPSIRGHTDQFIYKFRKPR
jgi:predicted methyltransferase